MTHNIAIIISGIATCMVVAMSALSNKYQKPVMIMATVGYIIAVTVNSLK